MNNRTIYETITLTTHQCGNCGITWAMPAEFIAARRRDGERFYCPNGDARVFRETEVDRLRGELESVKRSKQYLSDRLESEERRHAATKGQLTKTKKRINGGVCPCCNRSFVDLARHMAGQHPGYVSGVDRDDCATCDRSITRKGGAWRHDDGRVKSHEPIPAGNSSLASWSKPDTEKG